MKCKYKRIDLSQIINLKNPEIAYLIGFVAADGHIWKNPNCNGEALKIAVHSRDKGLLVKLKHVLEAQQPLYDYEYNSNKLSILSIYQVGIVGAFSVWEIGPRKSKSIEFPKNLPDKFFGEFLRGVFDGDGHVGIHVREGKIKYKTTITSGSQVFLKGIKAELSLRGISSSIYKGKSSKSTWYSLEIKRNNLEDFYQLLYKNDKGLCLKRKKDKFNDVFSYKKRHSSRFKALKKHKELKKTLTVTYLLKNYNTEDRYNSVKIMAENNNTSIKTIYKYLQKYKITNNEKR